MDILKVKLKTHKLQQLKKFYGELLGFTFENETPHSFIVKLGVSEIEFNDYNIFGEPYYHFALDIPSNLFTKAKQFVKSKTTLLTEDGDDEVDFPFSVAKSFYFEDPSGNIVEFIARLNDTPTSETSFSVNNILRISEMCLVVEDKIHVANSLMAANIFERSNSTVSSTGLSFMNDQKTNVFLLLTTPNRRWLFSNRVSKVFPIDITLDSGVELGVNKENEFYIRH